MARIQPSHGWTFQMSSLEMGWGRSSILLGPIGFLFILHLEIELEQHNKNINAVY